MKSFNWSKMVTELKKAEKVYLRVINDEQTRFTDQLYLTNSFFIVNIPLIKLPDKVKEFVASRFNKFPEVGDALVSYKDGSVDKTEYDPREIFELNTIKLTKLHDTGLVGVSKGDAHRIFYDPDVEDYIVFSMPNMGNFIKDWSTVSLYGQAPIGITKFEPDSGEWGMVGMPMRLTGRNKYLRKELDK